MGPGWLGIGSGNVLRPWTVSPRKQLALRRISCLSVFTGAALAPVDVPAGAHVNVAVG